MLFEKTESFLMNVDAVYYMILALYIIMIKCILLVSFGHVVC